MRIKDTVSWDLQLGCLSCFTFVIVSVDTITIIITIMIMFTSRDLQLGCLSCCPCSKAEAGRASKEPNQQVAAPFPLHLSSSLFSSCSLSLSLPSSSL